MLLQAPMEPFDYPDNDPGPQTLLTSLSADQNIDRLHWLMSRFQGYVGIVNYMGARFTATEQALAPVLKEAAQRGLIYVDDGSSPRSLAGQIAGANNLPFAKAEVVARRGADAAAYRPRAGAARSAGARARLRGRRRVGASRLDRAHRAMGEERRKPRLRAGADQRGGDQAEVELTGARATSSTPRLVLTVPERRCSAVAPHRAARDSPCPATKTCPIGPAPAFA